MEWKTHFPGRVNVEAIGNSRVISGAFTRENGYDVTLELSFYDHTTKEQQEEAATRSAEDVTRYLVERDGGPWRVVRVRRVKHSTMWGR